MHTIPALMAIATVASCTPSAPVSPDFFELANINPANVVPKSSPTALVAAFRDYCVETIDTPASIPALLRGVSYVEVPRVSARPVRSFVVDDRRPMVMLTSEIDSTTCAAAAESRTGQTQAMMDYVARAFPGAVALDPDRISPSTEMAWLVQPSGTLVYTLREGAAGTPSRYVAVITAPTRTGELN